MKKSQVNSILAKQAKRKSTITNYCFMIAIWLVVALIFFITFLNCNKTRYVQYDEVSDLDYKVYLKDNDFFEDDYLESGNQYIASLIDYIETEFSYELEVYEENIDYTYSYTIEADVTVSETKSDKNLYHYSEVLEKSNSISSSSNSVVKISKALKLDYNYYNNLIKSFVNTYDLDDVSSTLNVNMYVTVLGDCDNIEDPDKESVISLSIPLTTKTVDIDMTYDLVNENNENLMICNVGNNHGIIYLVVSIIFLLAAGYAIMLLTKYIIGSRTAETIYERELKKILNNYGSYIQKVNNTFSLSEYQLMKIDTFTDMLEIRDTINSPILMVESNDKKGAFFCIPSNTKILYTYCLKVSDIKKNIEEQNNEKK